VSSVAKPYIAPVNLRSPDRSDQYQISLEHGLRYHAPELFCGLPPGQAHVPASSVNYRLEDTATNSLTLLEMIARGYAPLVFDGSPPPPSRVAVSSFNFSGMNCRGRDMSLIDDTASK
jgi:hypothetical protein